MHINYPTMPSDLQQPDIMYTTFVAISSITIDPVEENILLLGVYEHPVTNSVETIDIICDFYTLNNLLSLVDNQQSQVAIDNLVDIISQPRLAEESIDLAEMGGLTFERHIFVLETLFFQEEEEENIRPGNIGYFMRDFVPLEDGQQFDATPVPTEPALLVTHYNNLLALRYQVYLFYRKQPQKYSDNDALYYASLIDPLLFALAKTQYELNTQ